MSNWLELGLEGASTILKLAALVPEPYQGELALGAALTGEAAAVVSNASGLWAEIKGLLRSGVVPTQDHVQRANVILGQWTSYAKLGRNPQSQRISP